MSKMECKRPVNNTMLSITRNTPYCVSILQTLKLMSFEYILLLFIIDVLFYI